MITILFYNTVMIKIVFYNTVMIMIMITMKMMMTTINLQLVSFSGPRKGVSSIVEKGFAIVVIVIVAAIIKTNTNTMSAAKIGNKRFSQMSKCF